MWNSADATEYVDVELWVRDFTPTGYPALLTVPFVGTYSDYLIEPPLRELRAAGALATSFGEPPARLYGRQLFEWAFSGRLRDGFDAARQLAAISPRTRWRMRIRFGDLVEEPADLIELRWEALVYPKDDWRFGLETAFARARPTPDSLPGLITERPIRLLGAAADESLSGLLQVFNTNPERPLRLVEADFLSPLTLDNLEAKCRQPHHCAVLIAPVGTAGGAPTVEFVGPSGAAVPWDRVADVLCHTRPPELVVVIGPAAGGAWDPTAPPPSLAPELIRRGVKAVLEFVAPLAPEVFQRFGDVFFAHLLRTGMLDEAVAQGRRELFNRNENGWDWVYPALTLRSCSDGQLFYLLDVSVEEKLQLVGSSRQRK